MPLQRLVSLTFFCALVVASGAANAAGHDDAPRGKDLKRAVDIVSKLRRLEEAAAMPDSVAYRKIAGKIYPGIFASVASLRGGDIKTDLSTAIALYESAYRNGAGASADAPDCSREMRATYFQLCRESASRTRLLYVKARMHTRFAEAAILYARGDRSASTLDALGQLRAERSTDIALADEALHTLKELAAELTDGDFSAKKIAREDLRP